MGKNRALLILKIEELTLFAYQAKQFSGKFEKIIKQQSEI